eukprot:PLAT9112.2.p1 GENE.PLAT9112.2~~PLAT9112.2.p1  ORF type:complete len:765 (-),score=329.09 PLAT9112.2:70-2364(-)
MAQRGLKVHRTREVHMRAYEFHYKSWVRRTVLATAFVHLLLLFWEPAHPGVGEFYKCSFQKELCRRSTTYRSILWAELVMCFVYIADLLTKLYAYGTKEFCKSYRWNNIRSLLVGLMLLDTVLALALPADVWAITYSRFLRVLLFVALSKRAQDAIKPALAALPKMGEFAIVTGVFLIFYAIVGVLLLGHFDEDVYALYDNGMTENFSDFPHALVAMYVLMTSENFPGILLPYYDRGAVSYVIVAFVLSFVILSLFFVTNLVVFLYSSYVDYRRRSLLRMRVLERRGLLAAFQLLDINNKGTISFDTWDEFLPYLRKVRNAAESHILFDRLDVDGSGEVDALEFWTLVDFYYASIKEYTAPPQGTGFIQRLRSKGSHFFTSPWARFISRVVASLNVLTLALMGATDTNTLLYVNIGFVALLDVELLARVCFEGRKLYWRRNWTRFRTAIAACASIAVIAAGIADAAGKPVDVELKLAAFFMAMRSAQLVRVHRRAKRMLFALIAVGDTLLSASVSLFVLQYEWAVLGMLLFAGNWGPAQYFANFDELGSALVLMFQCLAQNNWNDIMNVAVSTTSLWAALFFISFNFIGVLLFLNFMISLFMEAFERQRRRLDRKTAVMLVDHVTEPLSEKARRVLGEQKKAWKVKLKQRAHVLEREDLPMFEEEELRRLAPMLELRPVPASHSPLTDAPVADGGSGSGSGSSSDDDDDAAGGSKPPPPSPSLLRARLLSDDDLDYVGAVESRRYVVTDGDHMKTRKFAARATR